MEIFFLQDHAFDIWVLFTTKVGTNSRSQPLNVKMRCPDQGIELDLKVFPIDSTSNRYNRRYSLSFGDYWLDLFSTD